MIFKGYEVLEVEPNGIGSWQEDWVHPVYELSSPTGTFGNREKSVTPIIERPFSWFMESRADVAAFKAWLDSKKGRFEPFWVPTWRWDITPVDGLVTGTDILIANIEYTDNLFPDIARRYLAFFNNVGTLLPREVTAAVRTDDDVETLTLDVAVTGLKPACFLAFCRLASDEIELQWHTPFLATAELRFVELPREVA